MGACKALAGSQSESGNQLFEKLEGELDAAIVFAAGAEEADRNGQPELASACRADATDVYALVLGQLPGVNLTGPQRASLEARLLRLRQLLDRPRPPRTSATDEAA